MSRSTAKLPSTTRPQIAAERNLALTDSFVINEQHSEYRMHGTPRAQAWRREVCRSMIVEELYDALIEAGASEQKARAASRAVADMEGHFANLEKDISALERKVAEFRSDLDRKISELRSELRSHVDQGFTEIRGTLRLHNWMLGTTLAFLVAIFFKVFNH
jgi:hypothetical protein